MTAAVCGFHRRNEGYVKLCYEFDQETPGWVKDKHVFVTETRIEVTNNFDLINYLRGFKHVYGSMVRETWYEIVKNPKFDKVQWNKYLQKQFYVVKRVANAVIEETLGRYNALVALKNYELKQLGHKIEAITHEIENLDTELISMSILTDINCLPEQDLLYYSNLKTKMYYLKNKLNRKKQQHTNLTKTIQNKNYGVCFGSKREFKKQFHLKENNLKSHTAWHNRFVKKRDKTIFYFGCKSETNSNQLLQLIPQLNRKFTIKLRKHENYLPHPQKYIYGICNFKYLNNELLQSLNNHAAPVSYRIVFRGNKVYLQAIVSIKREVKNIETTRDIGVIGVDLNNGFLSLAETDYYGNLVENRTIKLVRHGCGNSNKTRTELEETIAIIVKDAKQKRKTLAIENLDFSKKKSQLVPQAQDRKYNKMLTELNYSKYTDTLKRSCVRNNVGLVKVNPANTSKIGQQKYARRMKLFKHEAAAFVIARRGQHYDDKLVKIAV